MLEQATSVLKGDFLQLHFQLSYKKCRAAACWRCPEGETGEERREQKIVFVLPGATAAKSKRLTPLHSVVVGRGQFLLFLFLLTASDDDVFAVGPPPRLVSAVADRGAANCSVQVLLLT
eukprot:m.98436 g.98436  ORF g.98436 m.98436 type:complete len:119 (+) comp15276_c0_seq1:1902-2258(+)